MKLEINTNGAWKTILDGLWGEASDEAMAAAAVLARLDAEMRTDRTRGKPATWRLVTEGDGKVVAYCGAVGWTERAA
jgi:hypothetical protein